MPERPLIGVTPGFAAENDRIYIANGYMEGINKVGGLAVLLSLAADEGLLSEALERCDGLLLSGGPDIDAKYYGEANSRYNGAISPPRDQMELFAAKKAFELGKPILGICRGMQVLNAAFGGTLYQDIYSQAAGAEILKHFQEAPGWYPVHNVFLEKGSILWEYFGSDTVRVNSFHHQSVKTAGKGLKTVARSEMENRSYRA